MDLTEYIQRYRGPLIGLIASWGAPWGEATEIAQDSFAEAYLSRESCRGDWTQAEVFGRWLRGVARNRWRSWARSRKRHSRILALEPTELEQVEAPEMAPPSQDIEQLRDAIDRLGTRQRQVILMRYFEETPVVDIAALLSVTVKTVEGRLYQARRTLHRIMEPPPTSSPLGKAVLCL